MLKRSVLTFLKNERRHQGKIKTATMDFPRSRFHCFHGAQKQRTLAILAFLAVLLIATIALLPGAERDAQSEILPAESSPVTRTRTEHHRLVQLSPSVDRINGSEVIWQIPDNPKAAVFIAHGCTIRAADYWDRSPSCQHCTGLPEDRVFVMDALGRGYAVMAVSSWGNCWSFGREMDNAEWIIKWWVGRSGLENVPLVAIGASSGGYFVSALAARLKFSSIVVMIAEGVYENLDVQRGYPPTLFVHMPKDRARMSSIKANMGDLVAKGVDVKEVRCEEFPVDPEFFAERLPMLNRSFVDRMVEVLRLKGFVDEKGYMRKDGRATPWQNALEEDGLVTENFTWSRHINEELNLAYAYHEFTSTKNDEIFEWFESHM